MDWFVSNLAPWVSLLAIIVIQPVINLIINWQNLKQKRREQKYETEVMAYREFARTYGCLRLLPQIKAIGILPVRRIRLQLCVETKI